MVTRNKTCQARSDIVGSASNSQNEVGAGLYPRNTVRRLASQQTLLLHTTSIIMDILWTIPNKLFRELRKRNLIYTNLTILDSHHLTQLQSERRGLRRK